MRHETIKSIGVLLIGIALVSMMVRDYYRTDQDRAESRAGVVISFCEGLIREVKK